jgi:hypothetical protein
LAIAGLATCTGLLAAAPVLADGAFPNMLTPADRTRLDKHEETRRSTLAYVREHGSLADVKVVDAVMAGEATKIPPAKLAGDWRCRTVKLAKDASLPIVVYADFQCRITDDSAGLWLHKLNGSQRTNGGFFDLNEARLAFVGGLSLGDEKRVTRYGESQERNQVGYLVPLSPTHMRLELPSPAAESDFDVLELRR